MKILSCTASRADGTRGYDPYGWWVPSGEPIRIILDTGRPEPTYTVREYGQVHTLDDIAQASPIVSELFSREPSGGGVCYRVPGDVSYEQSSA
jgi:hypothetical protein